MHLTDYSMPSAVMIATVCQDLKRCFAGLVAHTRGAMNCQPVAQNDMAVGRLADCDARAFLSGHHET